MRLDAIATELRRWRQSAALLILLPSIAVGQSLGEAAKREKERRKGEPLRTYGDQDLKTNPGRIANPVPVTPSPSPSPTAAPARDSSTKGSWPGIVFPPSPSPSSAVPAPTSPSPEPEKDEETLRDEKQARWRERAAPLRANVERLAAVVRKLKAEVAALVEDVRAGGMHRYMVLNAKAQELEEASAELAKAQRAIEDLEADAHQAGIPPGWIR